MKNLKIEISTTALHIARRDDVYRMMYRDSRKRFLSKDGIFRVVAIEISDYDGMEVTVPISAHKTWGAAEKSLKAKAQDLTFEERAKAFDGMKAMREYGQKVTAALQAELEVIRAEEKYEKEQVIDASEKRERRELKKMNVKRKR